MPFNTDHLAVNRYAGDKSIQTRELTQGELEAISGGKPAKNPTPPLEFLKIQLKEVFITSV